MKRTFDILVALAGIIVFGPLMLVAALLIRLTSRGAVFSRTPLVGRHLRPFTLVRFRTTEMVKHADPGLTNGRALRVTPVGRVLGWLGVDRLPELFNVLRGDLSLLGPRAESWPDVLQFPEDYCEVLKVRPGLLDVASLVDARTQGSPREATDEVSQVQIPLVRSYAARASLAYDVALILRKLSLRLYPSGLLDRVFNLGRWREPAAIAIQAVLAAAALLAALVIEFNGILPAEVRSTLWFALPALMAIRSVWFLLFGLHRDVWQYVELHDLVRLAGAVAVGSATFWILTGVGPDVTYPPSLFVLDGALCLFALAGVRIARRIHRVLRSRVQPTRQILVVGADESAHEVLRDIGEHPGFDGHVIGLVAGEPCTIGLTIHGIPIVGCYDDLPKVLDATAPDEILVVTSAIPAERRDEVLRACRALRQPVRILPTWEDILAGRWRPPGPEARPESAELLDRDPVRVDFDRVRGHFHGQRVLVTGAGGTIGSEIARQIAACSPSRLILLEIHEGSLYQIERELRDRHPSLALEAAIGDIRDPERVDSLFEATQPDVVFHAAAYKHVPMMERNAREAARTNVWGTRVVTHAADRTGVKAFVLISTDKAVEPVSVMGASKRMAELLVQGCAANSRTRFMVVRFGNVMDSSGSVLPLFREQIERGRSLTVTHPDVTRWFMTVSEATQLILEAGRVGRGGEVFVLDMGKPVRVLDLAESLIRHYGQRPDDDVPIRFTGLRPGERLFEKLFNDHEEVWKTSHSRILMAVDPHANGAGASRRASELQALRKLLGDNVGEHWLSNVQDHHHVNGNGS